MENGLILMVLILKDNSKIINLKELEPGCSKIKIVVKENMIKWFVQLKRILCNQN